MKNLLIICDAFPPAFAPRMGAISKYIQEYGWKIYVLTEKQKDINCYLGASVEKITEIEYYKSDSKLHWLYKFTLDFLFHAKDRQLLKAYKKELADVRFDAILCSTYLYFPLYAAHLIARDCNIPLIYDFRDLQEQYVGNEYAAHKISGINSINKLFHKIRCLRTIDERNRLIASASAITTISPWHKKFLEDIVRKQNKTISVNLIYNGYDPDIFFSRNEKSDKFIIQYTGRIIDFRLRQADLLFESIKELSSNGSISPDKFRIKWNIDGKSERLIKEKAEESGIVEYMDILPLVPQKDVNQILNESSIVLVLTNKAENNGPKGVMTTKLFEAMAAHKPILCVRSDESCMEEVINMTNSGLAAKNVEEVSTFILKYYNEWCNNGIVSAHPKEKEVEQFSRKIQAGQFNNLIESLL